MLGELDVGHEDLIVDKSGQREKPGKVEEEMDEQQLLAQMMS
jgi:hypothetical protein